MHRVLLALSLVALPVAAVAQQLPASIAARGETAVLTLHAEGAQVYECKVGSDGKLAWTFREPIATLLLDGKTVGRHFAGPTWEYTDGSAVTAKVSANAPAKNATDIPWLKLTVTEHRGSGMLSGVSTVQRINTKGGASPGTCSAAGTFQSVPYSADYVFLKK
jgi:FtsP/CotA-like multicopper oxidase with cupredoxin domain